MKEEIKILHVENKVCAVLPSKRCFSYVVAEPNKFIDFVQSLMEDYPQAKMRCVIDEELEKKLKSRLRMQGALFCKGMKNGR